jgi:hypothetical protein
MATGIKECMMCYGKGYIGYTDDDGCDVVSCDCTYPAEVKK